MRYFTGKGWQLGTAGLLLVGLALVWLVAIADEKSIFEDSTLRLENERLAVQRMEMQMGQTRAILQTYRDNLEEIAYFREHFLQQREARVLSISEFLAKKALERQIQMPRIYYDSSRGREKELDTYTMDLPLVGRYRDIRAFIDDIESSDMFLVISELSFEDDSGTRGAVRVQLSLTTYFEAEK